MAKEGDQRSPEVTYGEPRVLRSEPRLPRPAALPPACRHGSLIGSLSGSLGQFKW